MSRESEKTDFGFEEIPKEQKSKRVGAVFSSVAKRYDCMNDLMSLGLHHLWKRTAVGLCGVHPGHHVLDLAGGTGDLSRLIVSKVGESGSVTLADINADMMAVGRDRLLDKGVSKIRFVQANAEVLPFADRTFDCIIIGFGLRNVTDKSKAIASMFRVLKPGGRLIVLEFSKPTSPLLNKIYDTYSFHVLPKLGQLVAGDAASYQYLVESIRKHPDQKALKQLIEAEGFSDCEYIDLVGGIVAIHRAFRYS